MSAGQAPVRFAAVGLNHNHIYGQTELLLRAGAELVAFFAVEDDLAKAFASRYPQAKRAREELEVLEDPGIALITGAGIPDQRAPMAIRAMRAGKDVMMDKPGATTLDQLADLRRVQGETGRIFSVCFSERFEVPAAAKAAELVKGGALGDVVQTVGLGPHRLNAPARPDWFFQRARCGGILTDIGAHQADQFLFFTGSTQAEVTASHVANHNHPQHPELEDFGEMLMRGNGGSGYARVDWYTPDGLGTWGDGRLTILGTEGFIELRKNVDVAGRPGRNHLILVDRNETKYIDCSNVALPYGSNLVHDVLHRTETAMGQAHCFLAMELALQAEATAVRLSREVAR